MHDYTNTDNPAFSETIQLVDAVDPVHESVVNEVFKKLYENTVHNRESKAASSHSHSVASASAAGFESAADKALFDSMVKWKVFDGNYCLFKKTTGTGSSTMSLSSYYFSIRSLGTGSTAFYNRLCKNTVIHVQLAYNSHEDEETCSVYLEDVYFDVSAAGASDEVFGLYKPLVIWNRPSTSFRTDNIIITTLDVIAAKGYNFKVSLGDDSYQNILYTSLDRLCKNSNDGIGLSSGKMFMMHNSSDSFDGIYLRKIEFIDKVNALGSGQGYADGTLSAAKAVRHI